MQIKTTRKITPGITAAMACLAIVLLTPAAQAQAQSRTFYGSDGKVSGRSMIGSGGATTFYGADGRVTGRSSTNSNGTTTFYAADGRRTGTVTTTKPQGR